ncbi:MAG: hypothetical protein H6607_12615 [Flavobacteriales bacterium]|nr:hypothetical protein [Flavobacteriales bacterium]
MALIFTYIPNDFVDTVQKSDQSLTRLCNEVEVQNSRFNAFMLANLKNNPEYFDKTLLNINIIDKKTQQQLNLIDSLKLVLISQEKYNEFGYLVGGKREKHSNDIMIYQNNATKLFNSLREYKLDIGQYLDAEKVDLIDSILPLPKFERKSDGQLVTSENFYFYKHPLTISVLSLTNFKSKIELVRSMVINDVVRRAIVDNQSVPSDIRRLAQLDPQSFQNPQILKAYTEDISFDSIIVMQDKMQLYRNERIEKQKESNKYNVKIESLGDSIYAVGKPIQFAFTFDNSANQKLNVSVENPEGEMQNFTMTREGDFMFVPETKGYYILRYSNGVTTGRKNLKVIDLNPILDNNQMGTLYIGINNELQLKTSEFENTDNLQARISDGRILKKGKNFYARVEKEGQVRIEIFAKMPYGLVRIANKQYVVRHLNPPVANILEKKSGEKISFQEAQKVKILNIKSDELMVEEAYYISSFNFTIIYNGHTAILKPILNKGNSLNASSLESLSKVQPGDIVMFTDIKAKSSTGTEIEILPVTYTIAP